MWGVIRWLLTRWQVWVALAVIVLAIVAWGTWGGLVKTWWLGLPEAARELTGAIDEIAATKAELRSAQAAVVEMSKRIAALRAEADRARKEASAAEVRAGAHAERSAALLAEVTAIRAARARETPVRGASQAARALTVMGY